MEIIQNNNNNINESSSNVKTSSFINSSLNTMTNSFNKLINKLKDNQQNANDLSKLNVDNSSVRVALRIRPQSTRERIEMCKICTYVTPNEPQVTLGTDKSFTFDYVYDTNVIQERVFNECVRHLVDACLDGYNATVLAYGQTGSGKTYTMGTSFDISLLPEQDGIIPRAISYLFKRIDQIKHNLIDFSIKAEFIELYNEEIIDLFDTSSINSSNQSQESLQTRNGTKNKIEIHEDSNGNVVVSGCTRRIVNSVNDTLELLKTGARVRTTASTNLNSQSSRSHAIFTIHIKQQRLITNANITTNKIDSSTNENDIEILTAKFNFVDLAGSERLKRTGAIGERAKEGICINRGLLALGNVISALGDTEKRGCHVPYRDSKLTRLLQDSLGGNSKTLMIACVSSSDSDFMETLNTLRYANRARNIKNKVFINQDKTSKQIALLRSEINQLQVELMEYKTGKKLSGYDSLVDSQKINFDGNFLSIGDLKEENYLLKNEINSLRIRCKAMQETIESLRDKHSKLLSEYEILKLNCSKTDTTKIETNVENTIRNYINEIETLKCKLLETEATCQQLLKTTKTNNNSNNASTSFLLPMTKSLADSYNNSIEQDLHQNDQVLDQLINETRKDIEKKQKLLEIQNQTNNIKQRDLDDYQTALNGNDNDELLLQEDLSNLSVEIDMKQRLVVELESNKKLLEQMKLNYEEKLISLSDKIHKMEEERDQIIQTMQQKNEDNKLDEQIRKIKNEYEVKLKSLQNEVSKYSKIKQNYAQMVKQQVENEKQIEQFKREIIEMKKLKVKLINQIKNDTNKSKMDEIKHQREIALLKRDHIKKDSQIKLLEEDKKRKEIVLKRKQEQIKALKNRQTLSNSSGKCNNNSSRMTSSLILSNTSSLFNQSICNDKSLKIKWQNIENSIQSIITKKQTISLIERDMERYLEQREKISRKLNRCSKKLEKLINEQTDESKIKIEELKEQIETMKSNLDYIQDQINECQVNIIQLDESKDSNNLHTSKNLISSISSLDEAKYLIEQFYQMALNKGVIAAQKEYLSKELECELAQYENDHLVQQQLLQQMMSYEQSNEPDYEIDEIILAPTMDDYSSSDDDSEIENYQPINKLLSGTQILRTTNVNQDDVQNDQKNQQKARATITNDLADLLYGRTNETQFENGDDTLNNISSIETSTNTTESLSVGSNRILSQSYTKLVASSLNVPVIDVDEAASTRARTQTRSLTRQNSKDSILSSSPNGSPHARGRLPSQNRDDVFNRLTSETKQSPLPDVGCIRSYNGNTTRFKSAPLTCCHVAEGHAKAVLSVDSFENKLLTSSKDRTAKIWDLNTGQELVALIGHPNNVTKIKYCARSNLIFTVSQSIIKVWDERDNRCIKTLSSSGTVTDGEVGIYRSQRTLQNEIPTGEQVINDIYVNKSGTRLYTAAGNSVKIWDMSQFMPIGRLSGGHNASIMTLAVDDNDFDTSLVITGSKDHYIKLFDVSINCSGQISPKRSLTPPHYDGIQALKKVSNLLFSGSRDMCIKKWDLNDYQCKQSINNAHKDWICSLDYIQDMNLLVSGCRAGYLKFWSPDTCVKIAEFRAHTLPINSIRIDEQFAFTASDDATVRIWRRN